MDSFLQNLLSVSRPLLQGKGFRLPVRLSKECEKLASRFDLPPALPESVNLAEFMVLLREKYAREGASCVYDLLNKQKRWLPWIMYHGEHPQPIHWHGFLAAAGDDLASSHRWSRLPAWIHVYLWHFDIQDPSSELLRTFIHDLLIEYTGSHPRVNAWKARTSLLFARNALVRVAAYLFHSQESVEDCLRKLGFGSELARSGFLVAAVAQIVTQEKVSTVEDVRRVLQLIEMPTDGGLRPRSSKLVPLVASQFLPRFGSLCAPEIQKLLRPFFLRYLGDPRLSGGKTRWSAVSSNATEIFCQWLFQIDIEFFFDLVDRSSGDEHWRYRRSFWKAYLGNIVNTWVVLGTNARELIRTSRVKDIAEEKSFGRLKGAGSAQSVFLIRLKGPIATYDFVEWSHSGSCRAWREGQSGFAFGKESYNAQQFRENTEEHSVRHRGPEAYQWQTRLARWIHTHLGVARHFQDYRVRD